MTRTHWVIAYDVSRDGTRQRVSDTIAAYGHRVQRSVYIAEATTEEVDAMLRRLEAMIDDATDIVHALRVCGS